MGGGGDKLGLGVMICRIEQRLFNYSESFDIPLDRFRCNKIQHFSCKLVWTGLQTKQVSSFSHRYSTQVRSCRFSVFVPRVLHSVIRSRGGGGTHSRTMKQLKKQTYKCPCKALVYCSSSIN